MWFFVPGYVFLFNTFLDVSYLLSLLLMRYLIEVLTLYVLVNHSDGK